MPRDLRDTHSVWFSTAQLIEVHFTYTLFILYLNLLFLIYIFEVQ